MSSKDLTNDELKKANTPRKRRTDWNAQHKKPKYGGIILRQYLLNGRFVSEYHSIQEAVAELTSSGIDVQYQGIRNCILGIQRQHSGFLWRSNVGKGRGLLESDKQTETEEISTQPSETLVPTDGTTVFNPIQLYLLRLFSKMKSEAELKEVQQVLADYYFGRVEQRAAEIFEKKGWSQDTLNSMADNHFRTPYK